MGTHILPSYGRAVPQKILLEYRVFLVTVHDPIASDEGDLAAALYGSFLPVPRSEIFPAIQEIEHMREKVPGAVVVADGPRIAINAGRPRTHLKVTNRGDRPIQVCLIIYPIYSPIC